MSVLSLKNPNELQSIVLINKQNNVVSVVSLKNGSGTLCVIVMRSFLNSRGMGL